MRLRPSGESGPIASSLAAFAQYQREAAWTWEHMALTRARPIAGDPALCERVAAAIAGGADRGRATRTGCSPMSPTCAAASPRPIRRRRPWDLRNRRGGLVDLEFTVQYLLLREARGAPRAAASRSGRGDRGARRGRRTAAASARASWARRWRCCGICGRCWRCCSTACPIAAMLAGPAGATPGALRRRD